MRSGSVSSRGLGVDAFYTKQSVLNSIASRCRPLLEEIGASFVDFSCGDNNFAPLLGCAFVSFDIRAAAAATDTSNFCQKDWFTVVDADIPRGPIAVGLNPPFGYQGALARRFVAHAMRLNPAMMFLILPHTSWELGGYECTYAETLPPDAFYNPVTGATYSEIYARFLVYRRDVRVPVPAVQMKPRRRHAQKSEDIIVTRKWFPDKVPFLVVRRVGRNAGQQMYCVAEGRKAYVERGRVSHGGDWAGTHKVEMEGIWLKVYWPPHTTLEELIATAQRMCATPDPECTHRHPHAITHAYVWQNVTGGGAP